MNLKKGQSIHADIAALIKLGEWDVEEAKAAYRSALIDEGRAKKREADLQQDIVSLDTFALDHVCSGELSVSLLAMTSAHRQWLETKVAASREILHQESAKVATARSDLLVAKTAVQLHGRVLEGRIAAQTQKLDREQQNNIDDAGVAKAAHERLQNRL